MARGKHRGTALTTVRVADVPLREVSGVCLRRGADGSMSLVAIGDRVTVAAWVALPSDDLGDLIWETGDLTGLTGTRLPKHDPQIEAVCADGVGRVLPSDRRSPAGSRSTFSARPAWCN
jgi:hypothetical protein